MSDNIRALVPQQQFDDQQLEIIRKTVAIGLKPEQFLLFIEVCKHYRLNPMAKQIYGFTDKNGRMIVQTGIDGFRLMAERTGLYGGQIGPEWCGPDGVWKDVWLEKEPPAAARVAIIRRDFDRPMWRVARYVSYAGSTPVWSKMPEVMISKCAEALAFRATFPAEMSGIYTHEEMEQAGNMPSYSIQEEAPEPTAEDLKKARLNSLFKSGKEKGLYLSKEEMAEYISDVLKAEIAPDDIASLMDEELLLIEGIVASAAEMSVEAQSA